MVCGMIFTLIIALVICSMIVRSIGSVFLRAAVLNELAKVDCDVLCLQECGLLNTPGHDEWSHRPAVWSSATENRNEGVGVLFKNPSVRVLSTEEVLAERILCVKFMFWEEYFKLICLYTPAQKIARKELLEVLRFQLVGRGNLVVAGDFNVI